MNDPALSLVFTWRDKAVCHAVDPMLPAGQLARELAMYFGPSPPVPIRLVCRSSVGPRPLDPETPIGLQVDADAEIDLETAPLDARVAP